MRIAIVFGRYFFENAVGVDGIVETLVKEAGILEASRERCAQGSVEFRL